ncbi:MAG: TusE/DsrC/DsvC family sulfur relay protein [Gammaproteobacteria bacterium]|nr:TusE/DsrC/DsvC family sulfur relay protein [Gammaproteobacteria bacterium]
MSISVEGKEIATTATGFLENIEDWSRAVAEVIAVEEQVELSDRHWDLINHLRDEFINNGGNQPNTRNLVKAMSKAWGDKSVNAKTLYDLFPGDPSKQGGRIAGLPESRRKGGY